MKKIALCLAISCGFFPAFAGSVAGTGGGTEVTQLRNEVQLGLQYTKQVQQYTIQTLQLQAELKNLINNPTSILGADVGGVINSVGQIMSAGNAIGGNMARIDSNFANTFKNTQARTMSQNFTQWHNTSTDTLGAAMKAAGLHRDSYQSDTDALTALYNQSQATQGNLQAMQTLAQINSMQVQQMQKLGDLMATQNIAASAYMAEQSARQNALEVERRSYLIDTTPLPTVGTKAPIKWDYLIKK